MKFLIVALGNIGEEYHETRHNIGFMVADQIARDKNLNWEASRHAFKTEFKLKGRPVHMIKPTTYMNLSGKAVNYWLQQLKITPDNLLVITDDLALPLGKLRMRKKGSDGGHNGLKNIEQNLSSSVYPRLRMGIGSEYSKGQQVDYVLSKFESSEKELLDQTITKAAKMVLSFCSVGIDRTMNQYNN